ncbi:Mpo1-like protein [uncultured Methylibium sp.]|uniref:Mpo1 family 2-hydroxy fatty acid dioxygenase n=1 Tax=uncultured Methylibium sp. TaxID=381093 RepID=UPI0025D39780|nr:Mpo1-like protein [uncultured Methylibium sp.]
MRQATELMVQYAAYHRDRRNIATHFIGVPMIVLGVGALLARPAFNLGGIAFTPGGLLFLAAAAWYLTRGNLGLGLATTVVVGLLVAVGHRAAAESTGVWLAIAIGSFAVGWVIQFIGHYYEGRKPAFVDDLIGLLVGPMFVVGEWLFALGWGKPLLAEIERRVGPTHLRDLARPAT